MEIHKTLGIPTLSHPVPYATNCSARRGVYTVYTQRGSSDLRAVMIMALVVLISVTLVLIFGRGRSAWNATGIWGWLMLFVILYTIVCSHWYLYVACRKTQLVVNRDSGNAQIQQGKRNGTHVFPGQITVHHVELVERLASNTSRNKPFRWRGLRKAYIVVVHVNIDGMILGAFKKSESAQRYARAVQQETNLPIMDAGDGQCFKAATGFWGFLLSDESALRKRKFTQPVAPVEFR
jgi:hypothetical protein